MTYTSYFAEIDKIDGSVYKLLENLCQYINSDGISGKTKNILLKNKSDKSETFWKKIDQQEFTSIYNNNKILSTS